MAHSLSHIPSALMTTGCEAGAAATLSFTGLSNAILSAPASLTQSVCGAADAPSVEFEVVVTVTGAGIDLADVHAVASPTNPVTCQTPTLNYTGMTATFSCSNVTADQSETISFSALRVDGERS